MKAGGSCTVYVADYEGGNWSTTQVTVPAATTVVNGQAVATSPKTGDTFLYVIVALIGLAAGGFAFLKTRRNW